MIFEDNQTVKTSNFSFSHANLQTLGGTEYTLVDIHIDVSSSMHPHKSITEEMLKKVVEWLKSDSNPRKNNLLLRVVFFSTDINEFHGYVELKDINVSDYDGSVKIGGRTCLVDSIADAAESQAALGKTMVNDHDYEVNGIQICLTDGGEYGSTLGYNDLTSKIKVLKGEEDLESFVNVVLHTGQMGDCIDKLKNANAVDEFINFNDFSDAAMGKVVGFVSSQISSQSQMLGTGGPSQVLSF